MSRPAHENARVRRATLAFVLVCGFAALSWAIFRV